MSQDSQSSINSLELMSQETHEVLQALLTSDGKGPNEQAEFQARYRLNPFDIHLAEENSPENVEINIERLYSFPRLYKNESLDFTHGPDGSQLSQPPTQNHFMTNPTQQQQQHNPSQQQQQQLQQQQQQQQQQVNDLMSIHQQARSPHQPESSGFSRQCLVPANTDFPGPFLFDIGFEEEKAPPVKSAPWTYSPLLQKLFIKMRCLVPIRFIIRGRPPAGSYIKAVVVYNKPELYREIAERCVNHITNQNDGHHAPKHLLRCENTATVFETCSLTGRHQIKIPIREAEAGTDYFTEMFQFLCLNSCPGGLNRRPIIVIFTLEYNEQVLGRKILNPRICACPGRDRGNEEKKISTNSETSHSQPEQKKKNKNSTSSESTHEGKQKKKDETSIKSETTHPPLEHVSPSSFHETPPPTPVEDMKPLYQESHKTSNKRSATKITEGFQLHSLSAYKKIKREEDELFTIQIRGREKYELILKIKEAVDLMDMVPQSYLDSYRMGCAPCGPNWFLEQQRKVNAERESYQENPRDLQEMSNSQNSDSDGTPPSSMPFDLSQLSRTSSNSSRSSQGSNPGDGAEYSAVRFTLKRTVSLEKKGLKKKEVD